MVVVVVVVGGGGVQRATCNVQRALPGGLGGSPFPRSFSVTLLPASSPHPHVLCEAPGRGAVGSGDRRMTYTTYI